MPPDLVECAKCEGWFPGNSLDDVFLHATSACLRDRVAPAQRRRGASPRIRAATPAKRVLG